MDDESQQTQTSKLSADTQITADSSEMSNDANTFADINEKIRQQLKLLKMGKSDKSLFPSKNTKSSNVCTRSTIALTRRTISNESKKIIYKTNKNVSSLNCVNKSFVDIINDNIRSENIEQEQKQLDTDNKSHSECDDSEKPKSRMIDSLFNKLQSISNKQSDNKKGVSKLRRRLLTQTSTVNTSSVANAAAVTSIPIKRSRKDDHIYNKTVLLSDSNQEDSNQSTNSVSMEFLGFDISNKNVNVSALLPTPKVSATNSKAAFISEDLDLFMKENALENSSANISFTPPKILKLDEALVTMDTQPPNLSVPARPKAMQRPRTLAEKRMILQQQNDIGIFIIENESTVYHELKKRVKLGSDYDNTYMQSIQDGDIPFTRDCWRAACWIATKNNRFFYRTIISDNKEIKLVGCRGDNSKKVLFELSDDGKQIQHKHTPKHISAECPTKCLPIGNIKVNNIDAIIPNVTKEQQEYKLKKEQQQHQEEKEKIGLLKKTRLNMFSREYLAPAPKCKKPKCKANRSTSFDLEYGPLEIMKLPTVQLEIWPQISLSIPEHIKPILKTILPGANTITADWAKFAVSVVRESPKPQKHRRKYKKPEPDTPQSIIFHIPYEHDERKILIRRRRRTSILFNQNDARNERIETFYEDANPENALQFSNNIDKNDCLSMECCEILSNMIESVAIAVNETNFIKQDPDIDYVGKIIPNSSTHKDAPKTASKLEKDKSNMKIDDPSKKKLM